MDERLTKETHSKALTKANKDYIDATSAPESGELLTDLRAAVSLAARALERDNRPVRNEIAKELRRTFEGVFNKYGT